MTHPLPSHFPGSLQALFLIFALFSLLASRSHAAPQGESLVVYWFGWYTFYPNTEVYLPVGATGP